MKLMINLVLLMTFYWLSREYFKLHDWNQVLAAKVIDFNNKKIHLKIGQNSQQIECENSFIQILAENLPIKFVPESVEINSNTEIDDSRSHWSIISEKYSLTTIDKILNSPNCLFYLFPESGDWSIIKWSTNKANEITFETLISNKEQDIILKTASKYVV